MDTFGDVGPHTTTAKNARKRRSVMHRRPVNEAESLQDYHDSISLSSTPSDRLSDTPSDSNGGNEASNWRKELSLNRCISRGSCTNLSDAETVQKHSDQDGGFGEPNNLKRSVEGHSATASPSVIMKEKEDIPTDGRHLGQSGGVSDNLGNESKFKKVKLKVGGVTRTIHSKSSSESSSVVGVSQSKSSHSDAAYPEHKLCPQQENLDLGFTNEKRTLRGVPWKNFSKIGFGFKKSESSVVDLQDESRKQGLKNMQSNKKKTLRKKFLSDDIYDEEDDDDDEIRYLQKLKNSRFKSSPNIEYEEDQRGKKLRKISKVMDRDDKRYSIGIGDYDSSRSGKESKKSHSARTSEDTDYIEDEESASDGEVEHLNKKQRKESIDVSRYVKKGSSITTRRRAVQAGTDTSPGLGVQYPEGLPPVPPRKKKEQLSEVEQQLRRAEAAQRRKMQSEKAAQESQEEAIRKILGQDSSRKKREEKIKKRQQELAQERNANNDSVASNVVRWVMGPLGTVVTFPEKIGLPSIFEPRLCSYPPPREKCAGPSCTNTYKYRDSKSNLPLCSLRCYKALNEKTRPLAAC